MSPPIALDAKPCKLNKLSSTPTKQLSVCTIALNPLHDFLLALNAVTLAESKEAQRINRHCILCYDLLSVLVVHVKIYILGAFKSHIVSQFHNKIQSCFDQVGIRLKKIRD